MLNPMELNSMQNQYKINEVDIIEGDGDSESVNVNVTEFMINEKIKMNPQDRITIANQNVYHPSFCQTNIATMNNAKPNIGSINLQNSTNTTIGDKTIYNAPVTINNFTNDKYSIFFSKEKWKIPKKKAIIIATISISAVLLAFVLVLILNYIIDNESNELRIISREKWKAVPPKDSVIKLELPAIRVVIAHTVTANCIDEPICASQMRSIQKFHMEILKCNDIGYNFVVGGDGAVYVGRGWDIRGEHTYGFNAKTIGIAFIGTFSNVAPSKKQLIAAQKIIEEGVKLKYLSVDYKLFGQNQLLDGWESPGVELYKIIRQWDHWSSQTPSPILY